MAGGSAFMLNYPFVYPSAKDNAPDIFKQMAARLRRPMFRVQHTANMEEEHVIGGWRLRPSDESRSP